MTTGKCHLRDTPGTDRISRDGACDRPRNPPGSPWNIYTLLIAVMVFASPPTLAVTTLAFDAVADTYVHSAQANSSFGSGSDLIVDGSPLKQIFLRFNLSGLSGKTVQGVRLRMFNTNPSPKGGDIWTVPSTDWPETITWNTKPPLGAMVGGIGAVVSGQWHEISLSNPPGTPLPVADGPIALAVLSDNGDQAFWSSRETANGPQLLVDVTDSGSGNTPPVAANDSYTATQNTPLTINAPGVLGNDTNSDGNPLTAIKVSDPNHGNLVLNSDGSFTYTPGPDFVGSDSFTYRANDGTVSSNTATVTLTVIPMATEGLSTFEFFSVADTYTNASNPTTNFGTATGLWVDGNPLMVAFYKFQVVGLGARPIVGARLRLYNRDASPFGGWVTPTQPNWDEKTMTWNSMPDLSAQSIASFGAVAAENWYEIDLDGPVNVDANGFVSFAVDSDHADATRWASREHERLPRLLVDVMPDPSLDDGISQIAPNDVGSSDPTSRASQHRLALTSGGRQLAVHGRHIEGVQFVWRDPPAGWRTTTRGDIVDGLLNLNTGTGDWTASVVIADDPSDPDSATSEHAWIVYTSQKSSGLQPVYLRRLSELDHPDGPVVGPPVVVSSAAANLNVDLAFETVNGIATRGHIAWVQRNGSGQFDVVAVSFTDLSTNAPIVGNAANVLSGLTGGDRSPTLVPTLAGMGLLVRNGSGNLQIFTHAAGDPSPTWLPGASIALGNGSYPAAVARSNGEIYAVAETDTANHTVKVFRFQADGSAAVVDLTLSGYRQPNVATNGTDIFVVSVRNDGWVVSRRRGLLGWLFSADVERIAPIAPLDDGIDFRWPNTLRTSTDGRLRFIVEGPPNSGSKSSVLGYQDLWVP